MRIVFAGTPEFAAVVLSALLDSEHQVCAVYTQPDRPAGRGRKLMPSAVKEVALAAGLPVYQPESLRDAQAQEELVALQPDLMVVIAYGLILPQVVLDMPKLGCVNLHASLLPRWRGAAPIQRAIEAGDTQTGLCLMQMEAGLDTGPVLATQRLAIGPDTTGGALHDELAQLGATFLPGWLVQLQAGELSPQVQAQDGVTYAHKLDKAQAQIDWSLPAEQLALRIRAFNPWPVAYSELDGQNVKLWSVAAVHADVSARPGLILRADTQGLLVACGHGALLLDELQFPGGKRLPVAALILGRALQGCRFVTV